MPQKNELHYGDNLEVLRGIADESVDLVYLDPPFNSSATYNVLFKEQDGTGSESQIKAFEDTWHWDQGAEATYHEMIQLADNVGRALEAFLTLLGRNDMLAYLTMMAPRLVELRRVLKPTGSIYLHCDPAASHYLKILLDAVFSVERFQNEIIWQRTLAKALMTRRLPSNHDVILVYRMSDESTWNGDTLYQAYDQNALDDKTASKYSQVDDDGRPYQLTSLCNPNPDRPNLTYEFLGVTRVWRWTKERMEEAYEAGLVVQPRPGAVPRFKRYLDEQRGKPYGDVWTDIPPLNSQAQERLGYPTQKPEALLARIIRAASNEGDTVLDPFCGCGTSIAAAHALKRRWIGIDITHLAIGLVQNRLLTAFTSSVVGTYQVFGLPTDLAGARALAELDRYQFQYWAVTLIGAFPKQEKKGADKGIDGIIVFVDDQTGKAKRIIVSVKSGKLKPDDIRALSGVVDREKAAMGVLITLDPPTKHMRTDAVAAGFYVSPLWKHLELPKIQILTVEGLLDRTEQLKSPPLDQASRTFKTAPKSKVGKKDVQTSLFDDHGHEADEDS